MITPVTSKNFFIHEDDSLREEATSISPNIWSKDPSKTAVNFKDAKQIISKETDFTWAIYFKSKRKILSIDGISNHHYQVIKCTSHEACPAKVVILSQLCTYVLIFLYI